MALNIGKEIAAMKHMTVPQLREKYAEVFGEETRSRHKDHLLRRIAWRLQANVEGDLSDRARRRAMELAKDSDVRLTAPRKAPPSSGGPTTVGTIHISQDDRLPLPGTEIVREYKGETIVVRVLPHGFEHEGEIYRTLTAVAKAVTGKHWNGYHFFRLGKKGNGNGKKKD
jgi:hypothetical protein